VRHARLAILLQHALGLDPASQFEYLAYSFIVAEWSDWALGFFNVVASRPGKGKSFVQLVEVKRTSKESRTQGNISHVAFAGPHC
jgi:hypothetical protein